MHELNFIGNGIYIGWASVNSGPVFKTVMSIGRNPYFSNQEVTIEPHILHQFDSDFYGEELKLAIVAFLRKEANFPTLDALVAQIHRDIQDADLILENPKFSKVKGDSFFHAPFANEAVADK